MYVNYFVEKKIVFIRFSHSFPFPVPPQIQRLRLGRTSLTPFGYVKQRCVGRSRVIINIIFF